MLIPYINSSAALPATALLRTPLVPDLTRDSPGLAAMTDFLCERPVIVSPERRVDDALHDMIVAGIRALLVVNDSTVLGLITAADILGTRPIQFLQNPQCEGSPCRRRDVHVADIMTPWPALRLLHSASVAAATVGDLVDYFSDTDATHLLVIETSSRSGDIVRGLLSRTRLARQLGIELPGTSA
jgi:CBS domain-containing protein